MYVAWFGEKLPLYIPDLANKKLLPSIDRTRVVRRYFCEVKKRGGILCW